MSTLISSKFTARVRVNYWIFLIVKKLKTIVVKNTNCCIHQLCELFYMEALSLSQGLFNKCSIIFILKLSWATGDTNSAWHPDGAKITTRTKKIPDGSATWPQLFFWRHPTPAPATPTLTAIESRANHWWRIQLSSAPWRCRKPRL